MIPRVLIVEDEIYIQRLIRMTLEKSGMTVAIAKNGEDALKELEKATLPDVILLDIMMPGIDGLQLLRTLKANSRTKNIPIVMLTALAQENVVLQGVKLGAKDYIRKPFNPTELAERLRKVLPGSS